MIPVKQAYRSYQHEVKFRGTQKQILAMEAFIHGSQYRLGWEVIVHSGMIQIYPKRKDDMTVSEMVKLGWDLKEVWERNAVFLSE